MVREVLIHIDGAAKGNPGPAAIGIIAHTMDGITFFQRSQYIGETTNNVAEYTALLEALKMALAHGIRTARVASDSELVVRQMNGSYQVKKPHLKELYDQAIQLSGKFKEIEIFHVPRIENEEADSLANQAINEKNNSKKNP